MDVPSHAEVVDLIDVFLARHGMAPSRLGRDALGEPQFVSDVRKGRTPNLLTLTKLRDFMAMRDDLLMSAGSSVVVDELHRLSAGGR